jgi:hypothetical protein
MNRIVPESWRKLYDRCMSGKAGPRAVIRMMCGECVGYIRDEVVQCTDINCPAYQYRPFCGIKRRKAPDAKK